VLGRRLYDDVDLSTAQHWTTFGPPVFLQRWTAKAQLAPVESSGSPFLNDSADASARPSSGRGGLAHRLLPRLDLMLVEPQSPGSPRPGRRRSPSVAREPGARVIAGRAALLVAAGLGAAGCPNQAAAPGCPTAHYLVAVAADAEPGGPVYVADDLALTAGYPYAVERADTLDPVLRSNDDGTDIALLAPAAGGVIVVNGGAAARRFDAAGALLWTIDYGAFVGVRAGLDAGDRLVVGDVRSVRLFEPDGTVGWEQPLPDTVEEVVQVIGDREGGTWVVGQFHQDVAPWISSPPQGQPGGLFVLHFDGSGAVIGAGVDGYSSSDLSRPAVASKDAAGAPMLVVRYYPNLSSYVADAFDSTGQLLWSRPSTDWLETDSDGNLVALSVSAGTLVMKRLDATGSEVATANYDPFATGEGSLGITTAPMSGGILVAGELFAAGSCADKHFLLRVDTPSLTVTRLDLGLP
jgi:hypothetical protein